MTLLGETAEQVAAAQRQLARIGIDRPAAIATGRPEDWAAGEPLASFPVADFAALAAARRERPVTVLDVRRRLEWAAGHLEGALHIPLHELAGRLGEIPGGELWVHCQAGYRSAVAASMLQAAHREVTAIDDDFGHAAEAGLPVVEERVVGERAVGEPVVGDRAVGGRAVPEPAAPGRARRGLAAGQSPGGVLRTSTVPLYVKPRTCRTGASAATIAAGSVSVSAPNPPASTRTPGGTRIVTRDL